MADTRDKALDGKVALVTGAVRRIGRAIALALAGDGAAVVINARSSKEEAEAVAAEIRDLGGQALVHLADVTDEAAVQGMADAALGRFGRLDILVNNAADRQQAPLTEISLAQWRHITGIVIDGAFLCTRACLPPMIAGGGGTIVNIGGATGHIGAHNRAHVITAKAALVGLTRRSPSSSPTAASRRTAWHRATSAVSAAGRRARRRRWRAAEAAGRPARHGRGGGGGGAPALPAGKPLHHRPDDPRQRRHGPALTRVAQGSAQPRDRSAL